MVRDGESLKTWARRASAPRLGALAEFLFQRLLLEAGHSLTPTHSEGVDFVVDGVSRIDVKGKRRLDVARGRSYRKVPASLRLPGVTYAYVVFFRDGALLQCDEVAGKPYLKSIDWDEIYADHWADFEARGTLPRESLVAPSDKQSRQDAAEELRREIAEVWSLKAKMVIRRNRATQEAMSNQGWGPEAFYEPLERGRRSGVHVVVLLYFDGEEVYRVLAYPFGRRDDIQWRPKSVGPNLSGRMTFDPRDLPPEFVFESVAQFRSDFLARFPELAKR